MEKKNFGTIFILIGIFITLRGVFGSAIGGGTIGVIFIPIIGLIMLLLGISLFMKMKKWHWIVGILFIIFVIWMLLALTIPFGYRF